MQKLISTLFYLFFIYVILQLILLFFNHGHQIVYVIENEHRFEVYEEYVRDKNDSHYFFEIKVNEEIFYFQTYHHFYRAEEIIKDIAYSDLNDIKCLLPIFAFDQIIVDATCHYHEEVYNYYTLKGLDEELDNEAANFHKNYDSKNFGDNTENILDEGFTAVYLDHVLDDHYVFVDSYRGIDNVSKNSTRRITSMKFFKNDVYEKDLKYLVDRYLLVANYDRDLEYDKFWVINLVNNMLTTIDLKEFISFNSVFQGNVGNLVFLYDFENQKQFQINVDTHNAVEVGNSHLGIKIWRNGEWVWIETKSATKQNALFKDEIKVNVLIDAWLIENKLAERGYLYYVFKDGQDYHVYQAFARRPEYMKYLFKTTEPKNIVFIRDFVYYKEGLYLRYYNDATGIKTLVVNQEFLFNPSLNFGIYIDK